METNGRPTVSDIHGDNPFAQLARKHWLGKSKPITRVLPDVLSNELWAPLEKDNFPYSSLLLLETLQILENYLWPGFDEDSSNTHVLLIALIVNVKRRENLPAWSLFEESPEHFSALFRRILSLAVDTTLNPRVRTHVLVAIIGAFQALDSAFIRKECAPLVSIGIWQNLHSEKARDVLLERNPQWKKSWKAASKRYDGAEESSKVRLRFERSWLYTLLLDFLDILYNAERQSRDEITYCERFLEFLSDLLSQFPTRRYVNTLIQDLQIPVALKLSPLFQDEENGLIRDFFNLLRHFVYFPLDDNTGQQYTINESLEKHNAMLAHLQRTALKHFKDKLKLLCLANYGSLDQRQELQSLLSALEDSELHEMVRLLGYRTEYAAQISLTVDRSFLMEVMLFKHERRATFQEIIKDLSVLPTEKILYEASFRRNEHYDGSRPLAIPKLNLQYLTTGDFLWRSFILYRLESFYAVRKDLEDTAKRMQPREDFTTRDTRFSGSSKLALPITKPAIIEVAPPKVGDSFPSEVKAEIILNVSRLHDNVRREWESLRPDDVIFLLAAQPSDQSKKLTNGSANLHLAEASAPFKYLRAAEIIQVLDDNGRPLRAQAQTNGYSARPRQRRLLVKLDAKSYQQDTSDAKNGKPDVLEKLNLCVRRRGRENNFKPVLESIRRLTLSDVPMPAWLQDVFLGLGDPAGANYKNLPNALESIDFRDTFIDWQHLVESLPDKLVIAESDDQNTLAPPYVLKRTNDSQEISVESSSKRRKVDASTADGVSSGTTSIKNDSQASVSSKSTRSASSKKRSREDAEDNSGPRSVQVSTYKPLNTGPYPTDAPKTNSVRFTPAQVEAITSGTQPGLTVIVGPPGTGKTDVATQIINNIYHDFPQQRTLLVAHSNQALNQLFEKIVALDIDERHLLRLGHGEGELQLDTEASYSKHGRVESFLENRPGLLAEVGRLAVNLNAPGAHGSSCETADYFNSVYVKPVWAGFEKLLHSTESSKEDVIEAFPFHQYFENAPQPLFPSESTKEQAIDIANGCYHHIAKIFSELADIRPFEILRNARDKANYLLVKEARIIAMTSTHAAIRRQDIANLGFHYDNVIMEEAAQITEIENFIPLALQKPDNGELSLKRVVLCGDHLQNSPVVQNRAFQQYANLEQSLFLRLVRLGVPTVHLDKQGRARPSLAELYQWRYPSLGNLPVVETSPEYLSANAGFRYDYQFIDVPEYKDKGETEPTPHFIQNLGEAEYAVALYMYMRLLGYPSKSISILTTYAGQRALIKDVLNYRCARNRLFGLPKIVATTDKYQGEQNDYIILSLVRTRHVGFLRDIRRLTVALSRARLGLYVLGRREVFESAFELKPSFDVLFSRPDKLQVVTGEMFPTSRPVDGEVEVTDMEGVEHLGQYVRDMTNALIQKMKEEGRGLPALPEAVEEDDDEGPVEVEDGEDDDDVEKDEELEG